MITLSYDHPEGAHASRGTVAALGKFTIANSPKL
jgi:hypothetical protein